MWFVIWVILFLGLLAIAVYLDAKAGLHLTFLGETDIAFVMQGNELRRVLIGLKRPDSYKIRENLDKRRIPWRDRRSNWLASWFGIHYVSVLYPLFRLHEFEILAEGLKDGTQGRELPEEGALMREWVYRQKRLTKALRWKFPRPFVVEEVELADRITVDVIVMTFLEIEDPYPPIFTYRGNFFEAAAPFVGSATIDLVVGESGRDMARKAGLEGEDLRYPNFIRIDKGEGSEFSKELRAAIDKVLPNVLGIKTEKAYVFNVGLSKEQQEIESASRQEAVEQMRAKGVIEKARGEATARRINAEAEAMRFNTIVASFIERGVAADVAANAARALIKYENIRDSGLTTWVDVEGGLGPALGRVLLPEGEKR